MLKKKIIFIVTLLGLTLASKSSVRASEITHNTVDDMVTDSTLVVGDSVTTLGYYTSGVGEGKYTISDDTNLVNNGGTVISLDNGLYAVLSVENETIDVTQFGAYADGLHNDSSAIQNALNSGVPNVTFEAGEYKCCSPIKMTTDNVKITGNDVTLFTDNDYQTTYYEWFFNIVADDIILDNLNFEARETITPQRKSQVGVMYANNITITNCDFNIPNTVLTDAENKNCEYTNLDLYTCWNNVLVDGCTFYDMADCLAGGNLEIRDIKGYDCNGCTFTNNICYANNHDEIIGVFCLSDYNRISDVIIKNNEFHQENTTMYSRAVGLSLGYSDTHGSGANNVKFEDNFFEGYSHFEFIKFGKSEDVSIKNNTLVCHLDGFSNPDLVLFRCGDAENITFDNNNISIKKDGYDKITALARGNITFINNTVNSEIKFGDVLFSGTKIFTDNNITFEEPFVKTIIGATQDSSKIERNTVTANNWGTNFLIFASLYGINATQDLYVNDNTLNFHNNSYSSIFLSLNNLKMNDYMIHCNGNKVIDADSSGKTAYLVKGTLLDVDEDNIEFVDNTTGKLYKNAITLQDTTPVVPPVITDPSDEGDNEDNNESSSDNLSGSNNTNNNEGSSSSSNSNNSNTDLDSSDNSNNNSKDDTNTSNNNTQDNNDSSNEENNKSETIIDEVLDYETKPTQVEEIKEDATQVVESEKTSKVTQSVETGDKSNVIYILILGVIYVLVSTRRLIKD